MDNRIMLFLVFAALVIGATGIYLWQMPAQPTAQSNFQNIVFSPLVKGCAETDKGVATKSLSRETEQEPKIEVNGNEILYSRAINHLCCRKVEIEKEIENSIINIYEVWSGIGCKCMCFSEIGAKLQNVPSGTYKINVYEKGTQAVSEESMEQKLIISQTIIVQ